MATKALTDVALRAGRDRVRQKGYDCDWRSLLRNQDASAIWQNISALVRSHIRKSRSDSHVVAQELFIRLLTIDRFTLYTDQDYTSDEISSDMISLIRD